ncbi:MAG: 2-oxo-4-hydroxy-4-carboxy-5-ureidoimidazoline decarboxylase [Pseudomonadota bacterium]
MTLLNAPENVTAFVDMFGGVYEHSPWVAERYFITHGGGVKRLHEVAAGFAAVFDDAGHAQQLELLRAHPDLAGRLAMSGGLTTASTAEQSSAGLNACTPEEFAEFQSLNVRYVECNGFPFILAVSGLNRAQILENFRARIVNARDMEFQTALTQVHKIARIRLQALI